jgi:hypothetical protein
MTALNAKGHSADKESGETYSHIIMPISNGCVSNG